MKLPAYPDYTDCALPWLERYPSHWSLTQTKRVCQFTTGWTPPTGDAASYDGDCPWANISDLRQRVIFDTAKTISERAVFDHGLEVIPAGSLMFSFKLSVGHVAFAGRPMFSNEAIASFRESSGLSLAFAYYAFPIFLVENAAENIYGAKLLNQSLIRDAFFPLPPKEEQSAIAAFLDREIAKIDTLIAEQERLLELLAEKRQAVITHAVTKGLNPNAPMRNSGAAWLGEVPAHWRVLRFGDVCISISTGPFGTSLGSDDYVDGGVPVINPSHIVENELAPEHDVSVTAETALRLSSWALREGDIVVARRGELGRAAVIDRRCSGWICGTGSLRVTPDPEHVTSEFLHLCLQAQFAREWLNQASVGSTMANLNEGILSRLPIALPPSTVEQSELMEELKARLSEVAHADSLVRASIQLLEERRSALIAAAVTGRVDVREAA